MNIFDLSKDVLIYKISKRLDIISRVSFWSSKRSWNDYKKCDDQIKYWKKYCMEKSCNRVLYKACEKGSLEMLNLIISKGAKDWNWGLYWGCQGGNMEIVKLMISKGANNWNRCLSGACWGGLRGDPLPSEWLPCEAC